ncbi:MAG: ATP-binding protein [Mycobacteriales bacterium]
MFTGREQELAALHGVLEGIRGNVGAPQPGWCILMRGRRRIGKSMLAEEFSRRADVPTLFYTASGDTPEAELAQLLDDVAASTLPHRAAFTESTPATWHAALQLLADAVPEDTPSVVILDELPYLMQGVPAFEGHLQRVWDRFLSRKPVLLLLIGSDLSMMEALNSYERPFHQRGSEMVVGPLNPAEVGQMLGLDAASAFDAAVITGGLPLVCSQWPYGWGVWKYLAGALEDPLSALLVSGERAMAAEFPAAAQARRVLTAIGHGERTYSSIARAAGGITHASLSRSLEILVEKRLVVGELPISVRPSKERRYRIADPYLRFWLSFLLPHMDLIERRRGDLLLARVKKSWTSWRGSAVEPLIRDALWRLLPDEQLPISPSAVGAYWNRSNTIEVDIVGADRAPIADELFFLGSIKWREKAAFDARDLAALQRHRAALTDAPTPLIAVSRSGVTATGVDAVYGPEDLIEAWARRV